MSATAALSSARGLSAPVLGAATVGFSVLYLLSDALELVQGGFSTPQLLLTYGAEAAIPVFVLGLFAAQRPRIGTLGLLGAVGYAYAFVFLTGTVLLALVNDAPDWSALVGDLGPWVTVHGLLMLLAGSAFGVAVVRAGVLPRWTGQVLVVGVVLVAIGSFLPAPVQLVCAGVRDLGFAGMGLSLLTRTPQVHMPPGTRSRHSRELGADRRLPAVGIHRGLSHCTTSSGAIALTLRPIPFATGIATIEDGRGTIR